MRICVTQEHIQRGEIDGEYCPIALTLRDLGFQCVYVSNRDVMIDEILYVLPDFVCRFVREFDSCFNVKPFDFDLPLPHGENRDA